MKIFTLLLFVELLYSFTVDSYSQTTKLNITTTNTTLENVINQIENQSEFLFFYDADEVDITRNISVKKESTNIHDILKTIIANTGLTYVIRGRHVVLINNAHAAPNGKLQQSNIITGVVVDEIGEPLPGVNVLVKGTLIGVTTDIDGKYTINATNKNTILTYSFVGYEPQEIKVDNQLVINVQLKEQVSEIDEVVVVGYGKQRKVTLTGSISTLKGKESSNHRL